MIGEQLWKIANHEAKKKRVPLSPSDRDWLNVCVEIPIPLSARVRPGKGSGKRGAPKVAKWEPWKALGMSRSTYYRKQAELAERTGTQQHAPNCAYHLDQYESECDCGLRQWVHQQISQKDQSR